MTLVLSSKSTIFEQLSRRKSLSRIISDLHREIAIIDVHGARHCQVEEEERLWTEVIETYGSVDAEWVSDIVSRAWGNRGNARSRQVLFLLHGL